MITYLRSMFLLTCSLHISGIQIQPWNINGPSNLWVLKWTDTYVYAPCLHNNDFILFL